MTRKRTSLATVEAPTETDVFDEQIAARQQESATSTLPPENNSTLATATLPPENNVVHAASVEKKKYIPPEDPFGFENVRARENRVRLLKSEGERAWVIRFAKNPNEGTDLDGKPYGKDNKHPVLKMLYEAGYRWGFDGGDGKGGWGKRWSGDAYGTDHMEARQVLGKAAEMIGGPAQQEQGASR